MLRRALESLLNAGRVVDVGGNHLGAQFRQRFGLFGVDVAGERARRESATRVI